MLQNPEGGGHLQIIIIRVKKNCTANQQGSHLLQSLLDFDPFPILSIFLCSYSLFSIFILPTCFCLPFLKINAEEDWRKSKLSIVISRTRCDISEQSEFLKKALNAIKSLCISCRCLLSKPTPKSLLLQNSISLDNFIFELKEPNHLTSDDRKNPMLVKQHSEEWFQLRKKAPVTGSTLYKAVGLSSLKDQKKYFQEQRDKIGNQREDVPPELQARFDWGTENEKHAVATLVAYGLPLLFPNLRFIEVGASFIINDGKPLIEVSADGMLARISETGEFLPEHKVEIKCPVTPKEDEYKLPVYYKLPKYYALQVLAEMEAPPKTTSCIFVCFSRESAVIMQILYDEALWGLVQKEAVNLFHDADHLSRMPKSRSENVRLVLPKAVQTFLEKNVKILAEVPSVFAIENTRNSEAENSNSAHLSPTAPSDDVHWSSDILLKSVLACKDLFNEAYNLMRRVASEIFVCMISTADRAFHAEKPSTVPIAFGFKSKSFSADEKWRLYDSLLGFVASRKAPLLCTVFDGEWASFLSSNRDGKPLTLLALQKCVYNKSKKLTKAEIMSKVRQLNTDKSKIIIEYSESGQLMVSGMVKMKTYPKFLAKKTKEPTDREETRPTEAAGGVDTDENIGLAIDVDMDRGLISDLMDLETTIDKEAIEEPESEVLESSQGKSSRSVKTRTRVRKAKQHVIKPLKQLCLQELKRKTYYKESLNVSYAELLWPEELAKWKESSIVKHEIGFPFPDVWFSYPDVSKEREQLEPR